MPKLIVLGTAYAVPDVEHENTHLVLVGEERSLLIDCASNPIVRLRKIGIEVQTISDLILTHFHPDHASGLSPFLMDMWLLGRTKPLHIYGLSHVIERAKGMMELFGVGEWPNFYEIIYHTLEEISLYPVLNSREFRIFSSPVKHFIPTVGLRFEFPLSGKVFAYSCDTEPCKEVVGLAQKADVLFHEAAYHAEDLSLRFEGHSTAYQAAEIAREADVSQLYLIHYPTDGTDTAEMVKFARRAFDRKVALAEDLMAFEF
jgi:ribonuclease Z